MIQIFKISLSIECKVVVYNIKQAAVCMYATTLIPQTTKIVFDYTDLQVFAKLCYAT